MDGAVQRPSPVILVLASFQSKCLFPFSLMLLVVSVAIQFTLDHIKFLMLAVFAIILYSVNL